MKYYTINNKGQIKYDGLTTWINNSKWSWLIPVICFIAVVLIEGL